MQPVDTIIAFIIPAQKSALVCLKERPERPHESEPHQAAGTESDPEETPDDEHIFCRQCYRIITQPNARINVDGAHRHTFANPHGLVFEIGCFKTASGCVHTGFSSDEFTWFKGFSWSVAVCRTCFTHLGWRFVSPSASEFYGLILDHLIY
jgi:hypothetical protein